MTVEWNGYAYTECREYGHAWSVKGVSVERTSPMRYVRVLSCLRCQTKRKDRVSSIGDRTGSYDYADDYRLQKVTRADRRRLRLYNVKVVAKRRGRSS